MSDEATKQCIECQGTMTPVVIMDRNYRSIHTLAYRQVEDKQSFWTGRFATAGDVLSYMCGSCGRITLYGGPAHSQS